MYSCNLSCLYITATVRRITLKLSTCLHDDAETWVYWNLLNLLQDPSMVVNKTHQRKLLFCFSRQSHNHDRLRSLRMSYYVTDSPLWAKPSISKYNMRPA